MIVRDKIEGAEEGKEERPWQKKLRERWDRPIDDDGVYTADSELVQALKERKRLREEEEEAAKSGAMLVGQYEYGGGEPGEEEGEEGGAGEDEEYYSEAGEEQEVFAVRRNPRGRMKMSRVTAVKKKRPKG